MGRSKHEESIKKRIKLKKLKIKAKREKESEKESEAVVKTEAVEKNREGRKSKRPHRYRPGTRALWDIRHLQKTTDSIIPRAAFARLVKEILEEQSIPGQSGFRITANALKALQVDSEAWLTGLFRESNRAARNSDRIKITPSDFHLVHDLITKRLEENMCEDNRHSFGNKTVTKQSLSFSKRREPVAEEVEA